MNKMAIVCPHPSIITSIVKRLNAPEEALKKLNGLKYKTKIRSNILLPQETHFISKNAHRLGVQKWTKIF